MRKFTIDSKEIPSITRNQVTTVITRFQMTKLRSYAKAKEISITELARQMISHCLMELEEK